MEMETGILLIKMHIAHSTLCTGKLGNFNSLREVIWIILWPFEIDCRISAKKKCYGY